ncbi:MAG TPA: ABC transporter permease subunit [Anaerolineae bacterium]
MEKIRTIVSKEWAEVFKNRLVLFTVAFLPLILTAIPLITLGFARGADEDIAELVESGQSEPFFAELCRGLSELECAQAYTLNIFTLMFMILPVAIPVSIAAYSVVGEKTSRSLEPLLATPITTVELLLGKMVAAVVPAVAVTWGAFGIFVVGVWLMTDAVMVSRVLQLHWLIAVFVVGPLLSLLSVSAALIVSSRVSDPRVAEQLSALVILPLVLLLVGQSTGLILIDRRIVIVMALIVALLDVALVYLSVRLFQRETILTRWK